MPEWKAPIAANTDMGAGQPEYETISIRRQLAPYDLRDGEGVRPVPMMVAKVSFTPDELARIAETGCVYLNVMGIRWAPVSLTVTDEMLEYVP